MTIPHITIEQVAAMYPHVDKRDHLGILGKENSQIDAYNKAKAEQEQPLITAEEARKLEAGKAEVLSEYGVWLTVNNDCPYRETWKGEVIKYRAIKQEPVEQIVLRSDFDFAMQDKQRCVRLIEKVYALLVDDKTVEAKELLQKSVNNTNVNIPPFIEPVEPTCQVKNLDTGELKTMPRKDAKKLQAELGDTVEWRYPQSTYVLLSPFYFVDEGIFTCKLRGTVKLTIDDELPKMLTPDQCEAERLARIDTHDCFYKNGFSSSFAVEKPEWNNFQTKGIEYRLIHKQPKLISLDWKDVPVGVGVTVTLEGQTWILNSVDGSTAHLRKAHAYATADISEIELAPIAEQPWLVYIQGETDLTSLKGFEIEVRYWDLNQRDYLAVPRTEIFAADARFISAYRITGLAEGYKFE